MPSINSLQLGLSGLKELTRDNTKITWLTDLSDGIILQFFLEPPNLPLGITGIGDLKAFFEAPLKQSSGKLISCDFAAISGCRAIQTILKAPQHPSGMAYLGSLTLPFRDFSFVIKAQCPERGPTGVKESILFERSIRSNAIYIDPASTPPISGTWDPDNIRYDAEFPMHPVARVRSILNSVQSNARLDEETSSLPRFELPS